MDFSFDWKPEYSVGNDTLDTQHQKLLQICKRACEYTCDGSKDSILVFQSILNDLAFYASEHFETEEDILRCVGYPSLPQQVTEHHEYSERLVDFLCAAIDGKIDRDALEDFLEKWWIRHILEFDMQYSSYVSKSD